MLFHRFPAFPVVQLHPIVLSILHLSGILQGLGEQIPQVIVIGSFFEPQSSDVAQVLVEFLCRSGQLSLSQSGGEGLHGYRETHRKDL